MDGRAVLARSVSAMVSVASASFASAALARPSIWRIRGVRVRVRARARCIRRV